MALSFKLYTEKTFAMYSLFDYVPDDILVDILKHLDGKSLKEAALVCKRWSDIINGSTKLMRRLALKITTGGNRDLTDIFQFQRKFVNVALSRNRRMFENNHYNEQLLTQVLQHLGANITNFHLQRINFIRSDLTLIFRNMPKLTTITFTEVSINNTDFQEAPVLLQKLKKITASYTAWSLLECLSAPNLTYLNINGLNRDFNPISFMRFITTTTGLQNLIVRSPYEHRRRCGNAPSWYCKNFLVFYETLGGIESTLLPGLVTLEIGSFTKISCDPFCEFITKRASALTQLTVNWGFTRDQPKEAFAKILKTVFGNLKWLKELTMGSVLQYCPDDAIDFSSMKFNKSIKRLNLDTCSRKLFEGILSICTELESLHINELTGERAQFMGNNLNLNQLTVETINCNDVVIPSLKTLKVNKLEENQWQSFLKVNTNVQTLIVSRIKSHPSPIIDFILDETNVKHLTMSTDFSICSDVKLKLESNPKGLESFEWNYKKTFWHEPNRFSLRFPINREFKCSHKNRCGLL